MSTKLATFGAGCFWGVEATFRQLTGVTATSVGYSGGHTKDPSYKDVCYSNTGHAEVVRVEFDSAKVSYPQLLQVFFENHDPTTLNRQGPDTGDQYRSVVFYHDEEQHQLALAMIKQLTADSTFSRPIVTQLEPAPAYYPAEDYHQQYLEKRGLSTCHL